MKLQTEKEKVFETADETMAADNVLIVCDRGTLDNKAIAEIELSDENAEIRFPEHIKVIKEVTDDESYKNSSLAKI